MRKKKERRRLFQQEASMTTDDLVDSNTYKRFNTLIETVMESAENADPAELNMGWFTIFIVVLLLDL